MADVGTVYLVGAGPGHPGLITLRGLECLQRADLVLYDGLVNPLLLRHTSARAERTCRSSGPGGRILRQDEINARLIEAARAGKTVVRLKGGDPFIFGRGSEEAAALMQAGIPFEVVPGITAATAASEFAGISLTHREHASAVAFITGHEDPRKAESTLDYAALAAFPGTLVFYMGLHRLPDITTALINHGKPSETPAAVISRASTPAQQTVTGTLAELADLVERAHLHAPSLIVVGDCVTMRERIAWFESLPLFGRRVGITRPREQAEPIIQRLIELGAEPVLMPTIDVHPLADHSQVDATIQRLHEFDWLVFTSANGVRRFFERLWNQSFDARVLASCKIAAIGDATAACLAEFHVRADLVPDAFVSEALAEALKPHAAGRRILWIRASRGRDVLPTTLAAAGATVEQLVVYEHVDLTAWPDEVAARLNVGELDWIGLSSPAIARSLQSLLTPEMRAHIGRRIRLASISPITTAAAKESGLPIAAEARDYTWNGILQAIIESEAPEAPPE